MQSWQKPRCGRTPSTSLFRQCPPGHLLSPADRGWAGAYPLGMDLASRAPRNPCYTGTAMANLTITVDDRLLKLARLRALEQGTSVNALLREYLEAYAGAADAQARALDDLLQLSAATTSHSGSATWTREDLHERDA
jgi:hypothetical protein